VACNCSFVGYANWRREENGDNRSHKQVLVVRGGHAQFLNPRKDLVVHSPHRFSWGECDEGSAQLAVALLMEIFNDWKRVRPIYEEFADCFLAQIPPDKNWTAGGNDLMAMALGIETMRRKKAMELVVRALEAFGHAAVELSAALEALGHDYDDEMHESPLIDKYPFPGCFMELTDEILEWEDAFREWVKGLDSHLPTANPDPARNVELMPQNDSRQITVGVHTQAATTKLERRKKRISKPRRKKKARKRA
jgi:hypothetical protein